MLELLIPASLHYWYLQRSYVEVTRQYIWLYAEESVWEGDLRGAY